VYWMRCVTPLFCFIEWGEEVQKDVGSVRFFAFEPAGLKGRRALSRAVG
jgi:hypothetical protein